ncbi:MAG: hypothetical protein ACLTZY_00865 [Alistipes indistinctus]
MGERLYGWAELIDAMSAELAKMPGYSVGFSQLIIDMVMDQIAGAQRLGWGNLRRRSAGDAPYRRKGRAYRRVPGAVDVAVDREPPLPQLQINRRPRPHRTVRTQCLSGRAELMRWRSGVLYFANLCRQCVYDVTCRLERGVPQYA